MASRNLNMRGTRDRTKEFLEKVTEEHGDIICERKTRKNPLEKLSKEKRKLHKLEKRKRETNKETEVFLDSVNEIKKNIENLKTKVEEVRIKQGIFFSAPVLIEKDMAELEQLSDVIYIECYTIQAQIKTLERDSSLKFGTQRKVCCMQNEYLLSQMKKVMDDFRLMQTGYVDKRKRQYRENWVTSTEKAPSSTESVKVVANGIDHSKKGKSKKSKKSETFTEDKQTDEPEEDDLNGNSFKRDKTRWSDRFFKRKKSKTKLEQEESLQNGTENSPSLILENGNGVESENNLIFKRENSENSSISEDKEDVDKNDGESTFKREKSRFSDRFKLKGRKSDKKIDQDKTSDVKKSENADSEIDTLKRDRSRLSGRFFKRKISETNSNEEEEEVEEDIDLAFQRYSQVDDKQSIDSENANEGSTLKRDKNRFSGIFKRLKSKTKSNEDDIQQISEEGNKSVSNENSDFGDKVVSQISEEGDNSPDETEISFKRDSESFSKVEPQEAIELKSKESPNGKKTTKGGKFKLPIKVSFRKERSPQKSIEESETSFIASEDKIENSDMLDEETEPMISRNNHKSESSGSANIILDLTPKNSSQPLEHERLIGTPSDISNGVNAEKGKKAKRKLFFFKKQKSESAFKPNGLQSSPLQETSENHEQEEESPLIAKYNEVNVDSKSRQIITLGPEKTINSNCASNLRNGENLVINVEGKKSEIETGPIIRRKSDQSFTDSEKSIESSAEVSFIESNGRGGKSRFNGIFRSKRSKSETISELDESQQKLIDTSQNRYMEERKDNNAKVENDTSSGIQIQHLADGHMKGDIETEKSKEELKAIELREERLKNLEQNISGIADLQKELHSIVHSGGEQMDSIEDYADNSKYNVQYGQAQLIKAEKYQTKFRKRRMILATVGVVVIVVIVIVILIVTV
ncbi:t-SNARE domain-containing protein 1 [Mytilus galloprovincialis]|uniref:t-SNARE domain-containing protein 1 n=1 Tax=Mytilus galloprovincialis TaxID=29158 RepID=A0A8B6BHT6_MYTGA|nr:t-SNARE domain-containing protein 1 [Mytilus galloprovincialis]